MKVYIYKDKEIEADWVFAAYSGFKQLGADISFFKDIESIPYTPDTVIVADVEPTIKYMQLNNIKVANPLNIPTELNSYTYKGRHTTIESLFSAKSRRDPIFIKPYQVVKQFPSGVVSDPAKLNYLLMDIPDSTLVFVSQILDFQSEYRCFVYDKKLVGMKHYTGDFRLAPDLGHIHSMIQDYEHCPVAYTLDVGIVSDTHETRLVECNDFWSIGHYGLDPILYAKMLRDRWFQITGFKK